MPQLTTTPAMIGFQEIMVIWLERRQPRRWDCRAALLLARALGTATKFYLLFGLAFIERNFTSIIVNLIRKMTRYANLRGNSPVVAYDIQPTKIIVQFKTGRPYSYSYMSAGRDNVEMMKQLAMRGAGLSAFITRNARYNYE